MIIAALVMPIAIGFTALAVEGGLWYADHHQLRNIADTAALAAGWAYYEGSNEADAAEAAVTGEGYNTTSDSLDLVSPPTAGPYAGDPQSIQVTAHRSRTPLFSRLFLGSNNVDIAAIAVVQLGSRSGACVLALDPHAAGALTAQGSANIDFNGCGVNVDSNAAGALDVGGAALLDVQWTEVTGTIATNGGGTLESSQTPRTGMPPRPDPYADLTMPGSGSCNYSNLSVHGTAILTPGRYCGGVSFQAHANVTLAPGTYIMDGGSFDVSGNSAVTGDGVTIILTGSGSNYATVTINGGAVVDISAPSTGTYAGIAFTQDPNAPSGVTNKFNGGSTMDIDGVIHMPNQAIQFTGGNTTGNRCTRLVADTITFSGNAVMGNNCTGYGLSNTTDDDPRLVD